MYGSSSTVTVPRRSEAMESRRSFRLGTSPRKTSRSVYAREYRHNDHHYSRSRKADVTPSPSVAAETQDDFSHPAWPAAHGDPVEAADQSHNVAEPHFFSEEAFYPASYAHPPSQSPSGTSDGANQPTRPKQYHGRGGWSVDGRGAYCQGGGCTRPPSYSVDGRKPAVLCGNHRENGMYRVFHDNRMCGYRGCARTAHVRYMSEDGKVNRFCHKHKKPDVIVTKTKHCEYAGCMSTPSYGTKEGPQNFCAEHKRAGMYTNRNGVLLFATRDGSAYKTKASDKAQSGGIKVSSRVNEAPHSPHRSATAAPPEAGSTLHRDTEASQDSPGKNIPLNRKLCEVPGCNVQPSYGETGTGRPRFCAGHKKKGMVGLKNRPCLFPGCDTRPHYGLSGGRPQYCATHKSDEMIHLLKESMNRVRVRRARVRAPRKKEDCAPSESEKKEEDSPTAKDSIENEHKAPDVKEMVGKEHGSDHHEQHEEKPEARVKAKGKGPTGKRKAAIASTGIAATKLKISSPKPPAETPPSAIVSASSSSSPRLPVSSPPAFKGVPSPIVTDFDLAPAAQNSAAEDKQTSPTSRMAETPGMAPSAEIQLFREARASAKALATANGSGRRARAPSRKALEASGKMSSEGAQWMTKEKRQEQGRLKKELKEQRRAAAAAGLKTGHVIEACAVVVEGGEGGGGGAGGRSGGSDDRDGGVVPTNPPTWRKLSPAEILQSTAFSTALAAGNANSKTPDNKATSEPKDENKHATSEPKSASIDDATQPKAGSNAVTSELKAGNKDIITEPKAGVGSGKQRGRGVAAPVAVEASKEPANSGGKQRGRLVATPVATEASKESGKKRKKVASESEGVLPTSDVGTSKKKRKRVRKSKQAAENDSNPRMEQAPKKEVNQRSGRRGQEGTGGGAPGRSTMCEFQSCKQKAKYGVNGTVRFCKMHRPLGLHKIKDRK